MAAASKVMSLCLLVILQALLLSHPAYCHDKAEDDLYLFVAAKTEDDLFQGLNSFRNSHNLPDLKKNLKAASCLADELADELEDQPCSSADGYTINPGNGPQFPSFNKLIKKCHIDVSTTTDGIIWPVCVRKLSPDDLVINNYTHTQPAKYLRDSKYTGVGIGSEDDWIVVVLTTDAQSGSFSGSAALLPNAMFHYYMVAILSGLFLVLLS